MLTWPMLPIFDFLLQGEKNYKEKTNSQDMMYKKFWSPDSQSLQGWWYSERHEVWPSDYVLLGNIKCMVIYHSHSSLQGKVARNGIGIPATKLFYISNNETFQGCIFQLEPKN